MEASDYVDSARISAMCLVFTVEPIRDSRPAICMRQLASHATTVSAPQLLIASILLSRMATEISGYLTENVPPKPQQASAFGISTNSALSMFFNKVRGSCFSPSSRRQWQASCHVTRPENDEPK